MVNDISEFKNIEYEKRKECNSCDTPLQGESVLKFPNYPLSEVYSNEKSTEEVGVCDQELYLCNTCGHAQLLNIIPPNLLYFGTNYFLRTSKSKTASAAVDFYLDFVDSVLEKKNFEIIADIGCNDLYQLDTLASRAKKLIGIDPVLKGHEKELGSEKMILYGDLFEAAASEHNLQFDDALVMSSHTLEHVKDPKALVKEVLDRSTNNTVFAFQFPGFEGLVRDARFDQIFHQHYNLYTVQSVIHMLDDLGAELVAHKVNPYHWSGLMIVFRKKKTDNWQDKFKNDIENITQETVKKQYEVFKSNVTATRKLLEAWDGKQVYGYGAANMLPVLAYHMETDLSFLKGVIDDDPRKHNTYWINLPVPIISSQGIDFTKGAIFMTAIDNSRILIPKLIELKPQKIIIPVNNF